MKYHRKYIYGWFTTAWGTGEVENHRTVRLASGGKSSKVFPRCMCPSVFHLSEAFALPVPTREWRPWSLSSPASSQDLWLSRELMLTWHLKIELYFSVSDHCAPGVIEWASCLSRSRHSLSVVFGCSCSLWPSPRPLCHCSCSSGHGLAATMPGSGWWDGDCSQQAPDALFLKITVEEEAEGFYVSSVRLV